MKSPYSEQNNTISVVSTVMLSLLLSRAAAGQSIHTETNPPNVNGVITNCKNLPVTISASLHEVYSCPFYSSSAKAELLSKPRDGVWPSNPISTKTVSLSKTPQPFGPTVVCSYHAQFTVLPTPGQERDYKIRFTYFEELFEPKAKIRGSATITVIVNRLMMRLGDSPSNVTAVCGSGSLILSGEGSLCAGNHFVSIQRSDKAGIGMGPEWSQWFSGPPPSSFDLRKFAATRGIDFKGSEYYRVKLAIGDPWKEDVKLLYFVPASVEMTINGSREDLVVVPSDAVVIDASHTYCELAYFLSVQLSDKDWGRFGPEYTQWFAGQAPASIDVDLFWKERAGTPLMKGGYYRVKLAVEGPWRQEERLIRIE